MYPTTKLLKAHTSKSFPSISRKITAKLHPSFGDKSSHSQGVCKRLLPLSQTVVLLKCKNGPFGHPCFLSLPTSMKLADLLVPGDDTRWALPAWVTSPTCPATKLKTQMPGANPLALAFGPQSCQSWALQGAVGLHGPGCFPERAAFAQGLSLSRQGKLQHVGKESWRPPAPGHPPGAAVLQAGPGVSLTQNSCGTG